MLTKSCGSCSHFCLCTSNVKHIVDFCFWLSALNLQPPRQRRLCEQDSVNAGQQRSPWVTWFCSGANGGAYASKTDRSWEATLPALGAGAVNPAAVKGLPTYSSRRKQNVAFKYEDERWGGNRDECSGMSGPREVILSSWEVKRKGQTHTYLWRCLPIQTEKDSSSLFQT